MSSTKRARLAELKERLRDLESRDPSHCADTGRSGSRAYVPHTMPPSLWQEIEDLRDEIKALEAEIERDEQSASSG